jgi:hypothetical protein
MLCIYKDAAAYKNVTNFAIVINISFARPYKKPVVELSVSRIVCDYEPVFPELITMLLSPFCISYISIYSVHNK